MIYNLELVITNIGGIDMNFGTAVVLLIVIAIVFFASRSLYLDKKKGKGCSSCPSASFCSGHCNADKMVQNIMKETEKNKNKE